MSQWHSWRGAQALRPSSKVHPSRAAAHAEHRRSPTVWVYVCLTPCLALSLTGVAVWVTARLTVWLTVSDCASLTVPLSLCLSDCASHYVTLPVSHCLSHTVCLTLSVSHWLPHTVCSVSHSVVCSVAHAVAHCFQDWPSCLLPSLSRAPAALCHRGATSSYIPTTSS